MTDSDSISPSDAPAPTAAPGPIRCSECGTTDTVATDAATNETYCTECGLVLHDARIDRGPEWHAANAETERRVGAPLTVLRHDRGLSSEIGWRTDGNGNPLSSTARSDLLRQRRLNNQAKFGSKQDRNLADGLTELQRVASALELPDAVTVRAGQLFRSVVDDGLLVGRSIESLATACVYAACRLDGRPRFFEDVADCARVDEDRVKQAYKVLQRELDLAVPTPLPQDYLARIATDAALPNGVEQYARTLVGVPAVEALANGCNPRTPAAGCLYFALRTMYGTGVVTQAELADVAGISTPSLRSFWQALSDLQDDHPERVPFPPASQ